MQQTNTATQPATQTAPLTNSQVRVNRDDSVDSVTRAEQALRTWGVGFTVVRLTPLHLEAATAA